MFVHVDGRESSSGSSKLNKQEAQVAIKLLSKLLSPGALLGRDIGIISPYKAMVGELRQAVQGLQGAAGVEVNTVDAFQVSLEDEHV